MHIVSAKFKNFFVALDALQQNKSGLCPKEVGVKGQAACDRL